MLFTPTYSMHDVLCRIAFTETVSVPLAQDFSFDGELANKVFMSGEYDIIFLNSPNNPTGNRIPVSEIARVCRSGDFLVVVDEAYGEFSGETCLPLVNRYKNLVVVRTFSKAFRLAAARVGYAMADAGIIAGFDKVKLPYNLNALSMAAAATVWQKREAVLAKVASIIAERERIYESLDKMEGVVPFPSAANFVLFRTDKDASDVFNSLLAKGVQIRDFSTKPMLTNCLRVTIGTSEENDAFLEALEGAL
jgi:histidinol-phosphate aminotransferase